jgi:hypothetical protein
VEEGRPQSETEAVGEQLANALYGSLAETPMWESFLRAAREAFACRHAALIFSSWQPGRDEPVLILDADCKAIEALHQDHFFQGLPLDQTVERECPTVPGSQGWTVR